MESPSGLACEVIRKRRRAWMASQISVLGFFVVIGSVGRARRRLGLQVLQDLLDAIVLRDRLVVEERQLRHAPQPDARAELAAQERRRAVERLRRLALRLLVAERRVVDPRDLQIAGDRHLGQRQEADAGIVHLARDELRQLVPDGLAEAFGTVAHSYAVAATRSTTNASMMSPTLMSLYFSKPMPHSK